MAPKRPERNSVISTGDFSSRTGSTTVFAAGAGALAADIAALTSSIDGKSSFDLNFDWSTVPDPKPAPKRPVRKTVASTFSRTISGSFGATGADLAAWTGALTNSITGRSSFDRNCSVAISPEPYFSPKRDFKNSPTSTLSGILTGSDWTTVGFGADGVVTVGAVTISGRSSIDLNVDLSTSPVPYLDPNKLPNKTDISTLGFSTKTGSAVLGAGFDAGLNDSLIASITGKSSIERNCSVAISPDPYFSPNKPDKNSFTLPVATNGSSGLAGLDAVDSDVGFRSVGFTDAAA